MTKTQPQHSFTYDYALIQNGTLALENNTPVIHCGENDLPLERFILNLHKASVQPWGFEERSVAIRIIELVDKWLATQIHARPSPQLKTRMVELRNLCNFANTNYHLFTKEFLMQKGWNKEQVEMYASKMSVGIKGRRHYVDAENFYCHQILVDTPLENS